MPIISATWEVEMEKIKVQGQPGKKSVIPHHNKQARHGGHICNLCYARGIGKKVVV
jgi:hypothetical protein